MLNLNYRGYKVCEDDGNIIVSNVEDFDLKHTFECGQAFRWHKKKDGSYTGIVRDKVINISKIENDIVIKNSNLEDFKNLWFDYFDLARDYKMIKRAIDKDIHMKRAIEYGWGMRILRQDFYEILMTFIISANNNVARIKGIVSILSRLSKKSIHFQGEEYFVFPNPKQIINGGIDALFESKMGYRARYILESSKMILEKPITRENLTCLNTDDAKKELMKFCGVGSKVAECVLLFSHSKFDVFPVDVWVKRVMQELYIKEDTNLKYINQYAQSYFEKYCGFAQQYLFYYARDYKIGSKI